MVHFRGEFGQGLSAEHRALEQWNLDGAMSQSRAIHILLLWLVWLQLGERN